MPLTRCIQMHTPSPCGDIPAPALTCARWGVHLQDSFPDRGFEGGGGTDLVSQRVLRQYQFSQCRTLWRTWVWQARVPVPDVCVTGSARRAGRRGSAGPSLDQGAGDGWQTRTWGMGQTLARTLTLALTHTRTQTTTTPARTAHSAVQPPKSAEPRLPEGVPWEAQEVPARRAVGPQDTRSGDCLVGGRFGF